MFPYIYDKGCYRLAKSLTFDSNLYQFMTISQPPMDQESVAFSFIGLTLRFRRLWATTALGRMLLSLVISLGLTLVIRVLNLLAILPKVGISSPKGHNSVPKQQRHCPLSTAVTRRG